MSALFEENFELYGGSVTKMLEGVWAEENNVELVIPAWETQGRHWALLESTGNPFIRAVMTESTTTLGVFTIFRLIELPGSETPVISEVRNGSNSAILRIYVTPTGNLVVRNSSGEAVAQTTAPVVTASTTFRMQYQVEFGETGSIEVRLGAVGGASNEVVIDESSVDIQGTAAQIGALKDNLSTSRDFYIKAIAAYSLTGTYNSNWPDITGVYTAMIDEDTGVANLTPRPRTMFGDGVLRVQRNNMADEEHGCYAAESSDFDLGTGDFTVEGYFRWETTPVNDEYHDLLSCWEIDNDERSWRLRLNGSTEEEGGLQWEHTTDGQTGTRTIVHDVNWTPIVGHIYHIAVSRNSGTSRLFIDGVQQGLDVSDTADIHPTGARVVMGGEYRNAFAPGFNDPTLGVFDGLMDEIRVTPGVGRYTANFTPGGPWPRSVGEGDSDFADVALLCGFDNNVVDESSFARTLDTYGDTGRYVPQDGDFAYQVASRRGPLDDSYLEAELLPAEGILTLTANPTDTETVTLGSDTYTFVDSLSSAYDVLIGIDEAESLENLANAINGGDGEGTTYGTGTDPNDDATAQAATPTGPQLTATAVVPGTAGNSITSTETLADGSWGDTTLADGADLPGPSEFGVQPLPPTVTGVRWVGLRHRSKLTNGTGKVQISFDVNGTEEAGEDRSMTTDEVNYIDRFEEDPDTQAGLTPTSWENTKIKINRTA